MNVKSVLEKAAAGCNSTEVSQSVIRPSKSGYTLLSNVLTGLVFPRLPKPPYTSPDEETNNKIDSRLRSTMSIGIGFLFESALEEYLNSRYPDHKLITQPELKWESFVGHADYLLVSTDEREVIVIDAKAFDAPTLRDIKERKLNDNWSYPTQLAVYAKGAQQLFPEAVVVPVWYVWSVPSKKLFRVVQSLSQVEKLAKAAAVRVEVYKDVQMLLEKGEFKQAAHLACSEAEPLIPKSYFYGRLAPATSFHYAAYSELFYPMTDSDEDGYPLQGEALISLVEKLMRDAVQGTNTEAYQEYLDSFTQ